MSASWTVRPWVRRAWTPFRGAVTALLLLTLVFRLYAVSRWSWFQDDWLFMADARSMPVLDYVFQDYNGHFIPGEYAISWLLSTAAPLDHGLAVVVTAALATISVGVWAIAFRELFGERLRLLLPLVVLAFSPLELRPIDWWTAALLVLPLQIFTGLSVLATARYCRSPGRWGLAWLVLAYLGGLLFWEKAVLILVPVAGVLLFCSADGLRQTVWRAWRPGAVLLAVTAAYLVFYRWWTAPGPGETDRGVGLHNWPGTGDALRVLHDAAVFSWVPGALGGPWPTQRGSSDWIPQPGPVVVALSVATFCVLLALAVWSRRRAWIPLAMVLAHAAASAALVIFSDRVAVLGVGVIRDERYTVDTLVIGCLAVAMLITPARDEVVPVRRRLPEVLTSRPAWSCAAGLLVVSLVAGNVLVIGRSGSYPAGRWTSNLLADVHRLGPVDVVDAYAPSHVYLGAWAGKDARLVRMLSPLRDKVTFGGPAEVLYVVGKDGHLRPAVVGDSSRSAPGPLKGCGYALSPGSEVAVPMSEKLYDFEWGLEVTAYAGVGGTLVVAAGDHIVRIRVEKGLASHKVMIPGRVGDVRIGLTPESQPVCVTEVNIGSVKPAQRG